MPKWLCLRAASSDCTSSRCYAKMTLRWSCRQLLTRGLDRQLTGILCGTLALQLQSGALQGVIKTAQGKKKKKKNHLATPFTPVAVCSTSCPPLWGTGVLNALQSQGQFLTFSNHIVGLGNVHLPQCNSISWILDFLGAMAILTLPKTEVCEPLYFMLCRLCD